MTGYEPNYSAWVYSSKDDAMYPAEGVMPVGFLIKDGSRIGLTDDFPVVYNATTFCSSAFCRNLALASQECELSSLPSSYMSW
jgi:hypothetical protein